MALRYLAFFLFFAHALFCAASFMGIKEDKSIIVFTLIEFVTLLMFLAYGLGRLR